MQIDERDRLTPDAQKVYEFLCKEKQATWNRIKQALIDVLDSTSILEAIFELEDRDLIADVSMPMNSFSLQDSIYKVLENQHS